LRFTMVPCAEMPLLSVPVLTTGIGFSFCLVQALRVTT
jgi:hypothetical protein